MSGISNPPRGVVSRSNNDGSVNPKYVDVLEEDKPVAGQKFVCISFISPEKILEEKNTFFFKQFLKQWDMNKSLEKFTHFLSFVSFKHNISMDVLTNDMQEFVKLIRSGKCIRAELMRALTMKGCKALDNSVGENKCCSVCDQVQ